MPLTWKTWRIGLLRFRLRGHMWQRLSQGGSPDCPCERCRLDREHGSPTISRTWDDPDRAAYYRDLEAAASPRRRRPRRRGGALPDARGGERTDAEGVSSPARHGGTVEVPVEALLADDPELALVWADMGAWAAAHPCECEALCECEDQPRRGPEGE